LKVLHVIASLDPRRGGPTEGVRQIARASLEWGQRTTVVTLDPPGMPYHEGNPFQSVALGPGMLTYGYTPKLAPWLRAHAADFDAVIVDGIWQYSSFAVWRALHGGPVPYFVFTHGMLDPYFKRAYPLKHLKKSIYWALGEYRVLRDARAVLFTCEEERRLARESFRRYRVREEVVGYGTAEPVVDAAAAKRVFYAKYPQLQQRRVLLFLSRIHDKKGVDLLLEAYAVLAATDPAWHLVLAGPCDEDLGRRLRGQAAGLGIEARVSWTGMLNGDEKWGALHAAEAFVLPSHQENFGIAVAEAMACGTPVLISDQVNIWREIELDDAGIVAADTLEGTHELLRRWSRLDAAARARMGENAVACFRRHFEIRRVARTISETIERLATADRRLAAQPLAV